MRSPTDALRVRLRELRTARGWSAREVAERCAAVGEPQIDRDVIANIETGRRAAVSIDELLVLARVLDVPPVRLMPSLAMTTERIVLNLPMRTDTALIVLNAISTAFPGAVAYGSDEGHMVIEIPNGDDDESPTDD